MRRGILLALALALAPITVYAQGDSTAVETDAPDKWVLKRLAFGVIGGAIIHNQSGLEDQINPLVKGGLSYNLGMLSFVAYGQYEPVEDWRAQLAVGARGTLAQIGHEGRTQLSVSLDYVWLYGDGYDALEAFRVAAGKSYKQNTVKVGTRLSTVVVTDKSGRGVIGVQLPVEYMPDNGEIDVQVAAAWQIWGGSK